MDAHETKIYLAVLITGFTLGLIIIYFGVSLYRHQRRNLALHRLNLLAEISTLEKERTRMAKDLHDDLGSFLTVTKFQVSSVMPSNEEDAVLLQKATANIDQALTRLREIAGDLMPGALARKGLVVALQELMDTVSQTCTLRIIFRHQLSETRLEDKGIHLYRVMQELLQNAIKHARATLINIELKEEEDQLYIFYTDNGAGFDYVKTAGNTSGFGLRSLKSRIEIMGGSLQAKSTPQAGTEYLMTIPLKK